MRGRIAAHLVLAAMAGGCGMIAQEYTSPDGRYRAQFYGTPQLQEKPMPTALGVVIAKIAIREDWTGTARMVMYVDFPPQVAQAGKDDAALDGACQGMVTQAQMAMLNKKTIAMNGYPGREVAFESLPGRPGPKLAGRARLYLVRNRLYQVFIVGKSGAIQIDAMNEFFNSFSMLDQGPGPAPTQLAGGPPAIGPRPPHPPIPGPMARPLPQPPANLPTFPRPGAGPNHRPNFAPGPGPRPRRQQAPGPRAPRGPRPAPAPGPENAPDSGDLLAFYNIPDPASAAIEAESPTVAPAPPSDRPPGPTTDRGGPGTGPKSDDLSFPPESPAPSTPAEPVIPDPAPHQAPRPRPEPTPPARPAPRGTDATEVPAFLTPSGGGATILSFDWADRDDDYAGTDGRRIGPGGGKDEHFRLVLDLPPAAIVEEVAILGGDVRWTTRPVPHSWPLAVVTNQELKNRRQSLRLGPFSGRWTFDLYAESLDSIHPGQAFGVEVVVYIRSTRHHLTARCQRK